MSHAFLAIPLPNQPCRWCTHYDGLAWDDPSVVWCARDAGRHVVSQPERGCAFYLRLTGVDDDPGLPPTGEGPAPARPPVRPPAPVPPPSRRPAAPALRPAGRPARLPARTPA